MSDKLTPKRVVISVAIVLATYGIYKKYQKAQNFKTEAKRINEEIVQNFKIDKDTVFAFDIHNVVANYNILKMILTGLKNPVIVLVLFYPNIYSEALARLKAGASLQEIMDKMRRVYPNDIIITKIRSAILEIASQLKPIQGTIDLIEQLTKNGYKVVFLSNIEPELWEKFIKDFPQFKYYEHFIRKSDANDPEKAWLKKPEKKYYEEFLKIHVPQENIINNYYAYNVLFIDDQLKNIYGAQKSNIPSYVFTNPEQLKLDLEIMGGDLSVEDDSQEVGIAGCSKLI